MCLKRAPPAPATCARGQCPGARPSASTYSSAAAWRPASATRTAPSAAPRAPSATRPGSCRPAPSSCQCVSSRSPSAADQAVDERRAQRQLRRGERECLAGERLFHALHFVEHLAGLDLGDVVLRVALAVAHPHFRGLLRHWLVREDANPDPATALDVTRHRTPRRLDLARRQAAAIGCLPAVLAEADLVPDGRYAFVAAFLLLAVLPSSWLQHSSLLVRVPIGAGASVLRVPGPARPRARRCAPSLRP